MITARTAGCNINIIKSAKRVVLLLSFCLSKYEKYCIMEGGMILTVEEFIMENISWIDLTMAGITLISVIVAIFVLIRNENATRGILSEKHSLRSTEHEKLSLEHTGLSSEHKHLSQHLTQHLSQGHQTLKEQQAEIKQTVEFLKDNVLLEQGKKDMLSQQMLDIKRTSDHISALVELLHKTQIENQQLRKENQEFKIENKKLRTQLREHKQQKKQQYEEMEL